MKRIVLFCVFCLPLFNIYSQVLFTQSSANDFLKGMVNNAQVVNSSVAVPSIMLSNQDWTTAPNLPTNLSEHQEIAWRSYVYLVGGFDGSNASSAVYKANILSNGNAGWETQSSLPLGIRNTAIVATPKKLYVLGGNTNSGPINQIYYADLNDDGSIGAWSLASITLPQALQGHKAQYINGYIYITGGTNQTNVSTALNTVYYAKVDMDGLIGNFIATTNLPEERNGHSMVNYDNKIYILGGYNNLNIKKRTVYYTNINNDGTCSLWQSANDLPYSISNHSSTCSHGVITVIGGEDSILVSNKFLYAYIDNAPALSWVLSSNYLYDRSKNGAVYEATGQIVYSGGSNLSGNPISSNRYISFNLDINKVKRSSFVSDPYVMIGSPKNIQSLAYSLTYNSNTDSVEVYYRLAGQDKLWDSWISGGSINPIIINQSKSYIQYMVRFFANDASDFSIDNMALTISGFTQLCGDLSGIDTLKLSNSPYWATCDVQFTSGTHIIEAGVKIEFSPNTIMEIDQANMLFNGTSINPIMFTSYDTLNSSWKGLYFAPGSNSGISNLTYTDISYAGVAPNYSNLYCYNTSQPTIANCTFRNSKSNGIILDHSDINITSSYLSENVQSGLYLNVSNPTLTSLNTNNNSFAGFCYASSGLNPVYSNCISNNNQFGIYSPSPDNSFAPPSSSTVLLTNNITDIAVEGGTISTNRTWSYFPNGIALLGDVTIANGGGVRLTIAPGLTIKTANNKGIYVGGNSYTGGEIYANGKLDSIITFTSLDGSVGGWNGLFFNDGSDYGSTSSLRYCIIEKGNDHNIYSYYSNEPHIQFCTIRNSLNYDIRSEYSNLSIEQSTIKTASIGVYLYNSSPSMVYNIIDSISNYGISYADYNSVPTFFLDTIRNSQFGIYYPNPDIDIPTLPNINFQNLKGAIAIDGGTISSNRTWNNNYYPYAILNNIVVALPNNKSRLTIQPGCTLKFAKNTQLQIGYTYSWCCWGYEYRGGELYAEGTSSKPITFTALNDSTGGWNGIYFSDYSDGFGSTSSLKYCTIEKGNDYNIWCDNTNQPNIQNCSINYAANMGLYATTSPISIDNSVINNNGGIGIYSNNSLLNLSNLTINNNANYGIYYNDVYYLNNLRNLQFSGNMNDGVVIAGGTISDNRLWNYFGNKPYTILGNILIAISNNKSRLTIQPGCTIKFAKNVQLQIGYTYSWCCWGYEYRGGELYAEGTQDSLITFTALNDSIGGWNGIYFQQSSCLFGSTSSLKYCKIEKGDQYNIWCDQTNQPNIANCSINYAANMGLYTTSSPIYISNSIINNNGGMGINSNNSMLKLSNLTINNNVNYGIYYNDVYYVDTLRNLQFSGNMNDGVVIARGTISDNRLWNYFGNKPYTILGNILIAIPNNKSRLTIEPGCTIKLAKNVQLQIGYTYSWCCWGYEYRGGELYAEGTQDSLITFTALNDSIGGWNGIYFQQSSGLLGSTSSLKYCKIEKGNQYNIYCNSTPQPTINKTIIEKSAGYGLWLDAATNNVKNSKIANNRGYGIYLTNGSNPTIGNDLNSTCDIYNNYLYNVYNNSTNSFNMSYNFLGGMDSSYIETKIYDYIDDNTLGRISFMPISHLPSQFNNASVFNGEFLYDNNINKPIKNAALEVKDYSNNVLISTQTNNDGSYNINPGSINVPNKIELYPLDQFGGVNATDALLILLHFTHQATLVGHHSFVADVNNSKTINGTDAMFVLKRFVGQINSFVTGDLQINCDSVVFTKDTINYQLSMLWFGDVNASYMPDNNKSLADMNLVYDGSIQSLNNEEFTIPIKIMNTINNVGAISLSFNYPDNLIEITGVTLKSNNEELLFSTKNGLLQTGWYNLDAINLNTDETFLIIKAKLITANYNEPLSFNLNAESEFADGFANKIGNITLSMPKINSSQEVSNDNPALEPNFPNPVNGNTEFIFNVGEQAMVNLSIYDVLGQKVAELVNTNMTPGRYSIIYNTNKLKKGVYIYRIVMTTAKDVITSEKKMIVE